MARSLDESTEQLGGHQRGSELDDDEESQVSWVDEVREPDHYGKVDEIEAKRP